jgi:hypothetical protein
VNRLSAVHANGSPLGVHTPGGTKPLVGAVARCASPEDQGSVHPARGPVNLVILALVVALRDVEQRRGRGKVLTHLTSKRPAA